MLRLKDFFKQPKMPFLALLQRIYLREEGGLKVKYDTNDHSEQLIDSSKRGPLFDGGLVHIDDFC